MSRGWASGAVGNGCGPIRRGSSLPLGTGAVTRSATGGRGSLVRLCGGTSGANGATSSAREALDGPPGGPLGPAVTAHRYLRPMSTVVEGHQQRPVVKRYAPGTLDCRQPQLVVVEQVDQVVPAPTASLLPPRRPSVDGVEGPLPPPPLPQLRAPPQLLLLRQSSHVVPCAVPIRNCDWGPMHRWRERLEPEVGGTIVPLLSQVSPTQLLP